MKKILQDRKTLYLFLTIVIVSVFTLSIAYAAMSTVLEIHGNSEVVASSWDIHLDNAEVRSGSVATNAPVISGNSTLTFDVELNTPGEFYEFTVDVVNDGSIDAMIDSVVKTPELTSEQAKYIKYEITYENGESISTKQTIKKGTSTPIKVRVEYRKDLVASDLPSSATELSLKLTLVYVQSDGSGSEIVKDGHIYAKVINGDYDTVGSEVCIDTECFYVISSDDSSVTMLAKYNIGKDYRQSVVGNYGSFSDINGWEYAPGPKEIDIQAFDGNVKTYVNEYFSYLKDAIGDYNLSASLITLSTLIELGCNAKSNYAYTTVLTCVNSQYANWIVNGQYWWTKSAYSNNGDGVWLVFDTGELNDNHYINGTSGHLKDAFGGVRPVITISKDYL